MTAALGIIPLIGGFALIYAVASVASAVRTYVDSDVDRGRP